MISIQQYQYLYSNLSQFNNPDSPTYTRRTKTGKKVVVRKGKRRNHKLALGAAAGTLIGSELASIPTMRDMKKQGLNPRSLSDQLKYGQNLNSKQRLMVNLGLAGTIGGAYLGYRIVKNRLDRGQRDRK